MNSEPADNPSDQSGGFNNPPPDSWAQPAPDSWSSKSLPPQPDGFGAPPPWPGHQTPPPAGPAAADQQSKPAGQFDQTGAGQSPSGQHQYPPDGQHPPSGQYPGQYSPNGQYPPGGQYPGQYPPGYGYQQQFFTPPTARNNRVALAALICGIGQFVLGLTLVGNILLAIPAIICGSIALKQIRLRGERGHAMAVAGLVLGILGVVYFVLILIVIVVGVHVSNRSS